MKKNYEDNFEDFEEDLEDEDDEFDHVAVLDDFIEMVYSEGTELVEPLLSLYKMFYKYDDGEYDFGKGLENDIDSFLNFIEESEKEIYPNGIEYEYLSPFGKYLSIFFKDYEYFDDEIIDTDEVEILTEEINEDVGVYEEDFSYFFNVMGDFEKFGNNINIYYNSEYDLVNSLDLLFDYDFYLIKEDVRSSKDKNLKKDDLGSLKNKNIS
jgi:hypothetical protein